mgnify:CR=1 FL=1
MGLVRGEADYGIKVSFEVTNSGEAGIITVGPWLSTSEGEWDRKQKVTFDAGETRSFSYLFHEPTVNASNIQYGVTVSPRD